MNEDVPGSGDDLLTRMSGGQFGTTGAAREFSGGQKLADEFKGTFLEQPARAASALGETKIGRGTKAGVNKWNKAVLGSVNGVIEMTARKAMAGQAIKNTFNERRLNALSDAAIDDAAKGLKGTEAQVALAREVDTMYGQYQKFSPELRSGLAHWTPFLPWYMNSVKFITRTLPRDHPALTSLIASASVATEEWRKANELSTRGESHVPDFLLGSYPLFGEDKGLSRVGGLTPFGVGTDLGGTLNELLLPQFRSAALNLAGIDWTASKFLRDPETGEKFTQGQKAKRAGVSLAESHVPAVGVAGRLSGLTKRHVDRTPAEDIPDLKARLAREVPLMPIGGESGGGGGSSIKIKPVKVRPVKVKAIKIR